MAGTQTISHIHMTGIHGHQEITISLTPGLNIIHGKNGTGKTTLLHVIANLFDRDIERFCHLAFDTITIHLHNSSILNLKQYQTPDGSVEVELSGTSTPFNAIRVKRHTAVPPELSSWLGSLLGPSPVYLPAFRSILDAAADRSAHEYRMSSEHYKIEYDLLARRIREDLRDGIIESPTAYYYGDPLEQIASKTLLCRSWFGRFVPMVRYPSLRDVSGSLVMEISQAANRVSATEQQTLSSVFSSIIDVVVNNKLDESSDSVHDVLLSLQSKLHTHERRTAGLVDVYSSLSQLLQGPVITDQSTSNLVKSILRTYDVALATRNRSLTQIFSRISTFLNSVNKFLEGKQLEIGLDRDDLIDRLPYYPQGSDFVSLPGNRKAPLGVLSSGERQVLTLLFSATHMSSGTSVVLIDEPEISLHVDWQRMILGELLKQSGDRQIIACTHSPEVAADHVENLVRIVAKNWQSDSLTLQDSEEIER